jgi:hypothetical protein
MQIEGRGWGRRRWPLFEFIRWPIGFPETIRGYAMFTSAGSRGFQMSATRLREQAARLLALSLRASDDGRIAESDELAMNASEFLDRAIKAEGAAPTAPTPAGTHVAQQQQQPQPDEPEKAE